MCVLSSVYLLVLFVVFLHLWFVFFFFKQKTAYEMRISDWSSDVCSSDLKKASKLRSISYEPDRLTARRSANQDGVVLRYLSPVQTLLTKSRTGPFLYDSESVPTLSATRPIGTSGRSEESRVGTGCVSTCRSRGWP